MTTTTYQVQHRFEGEWLNDGEAHLDPAKARAELRRHRELWPDEYRVIRIKVKAMDW